MKGQDVFKEVRIFKFDNAIVRVHIPDLTEDERARRKKLLEKATSEFMKSVLKLGAV